MSFLAPDFFGNPVTGNFWGAIQYQEATGYFSAIALILALTVIFSRKKDWKKVLFSSLFALSLILAFDNPISRLIYQFGLPLLSTGYASRWLIVTAFSGAFLAAMALEELNRKKIALFLLFGVGILVVVGFLVWAAIIPLKFALIPVAIRNLILPLVFMEAALFIVLFIKNRAWATWLLLALIVIDLGRDRAHRLVAPEGQEQLHIRVLVERELLRVEHRFAVHPQGWNPVGVFAVQSVGKIQKLFEL